MYSKYFGMEEMPFSIAPDPRYLYMSEQHREALAHLLYGFNSEGGFVLLTGEVGTGKTTVCRCLLEQIPEDSAIAFILNPKLSVEELLATICDEFGIDYPPSNRSIKVYVDQINSFLIDAHAHGKRAVLIIDESQNLSADVLEQLRLLTNLETNQRKLLQIMLIGQPELKEKLNKPELRQLSQRIIARYHLGSLSGKDVMAYVRHRLAVAGKTEELFTSSVVDKIYQKSGGVPRLINLLCDRALLGTYVKGEDRVSGATVARAASEVFGRPETPASRSGAHIWVLTVLFMTVAALVFAATISHDAPPATVDDSFVEGETERTVISSDRGADKLAWPDGLPIKESREMAFSTLFALWGETFDLEEKASLCAQADSRGLGCTRAQGNLGSLRRMDRPAVLKLVNNDGEVFYATLTSLDQETATVVLGDRTITVSTGDIEDRWPGNYTLLWRKPPGYNGGLKPGDSGPAVTWLSEQLAIIQDGSVPLNEKNEFDAELLNRVKTFQRSSGLVPDGVAGSRTIMKINNAIGGLMPTLTETAGT